MVVARKLTGGCYGRCHCVGFKALPAVTSSKLTLRRLDSGITATLRPGDPIAAHACAVSADLEAFKSCSLLEVLSLTHSTTSIPHPFRRSFSTTRTCGSRSPAAPRSQTSAVACIVRQDRGGNSSESPLLHRRGRRLRPAPVHSCLKCHVFLHSTVF